MPDTIEGGGRRLTPAGDPIVTGKFVVPIMNTPVLERPRLLDLLTACAAAPVTLVVAPAGSGKTVLVGSWVAAGAAPGPVAWMTMDADDDRPGVFWTYLITVLERTGVDVGVVDLPEAPDRVDHSVLVRLAARLCERDRPLVVVLDDAEALGSASICEGLDFLVRHTAGTLRLVLVTRSEPALPWPQYRLEGLVREIRFADLAFSADEAEELLAANRPELPERDVRAFSHRTRGWAAGLRLAELPALGARTQDPSALAASDIAVYFRAEVLAAQPAWLQEFLLATSVADRLQPALATHLTGVRDAASSLRVLARSGAFVERVPGPEEAYRYYPLVQELLTAQLRRQSPGRWRRLQRKAAQWFAAQGSVDDAVRHFAAAGDWDDAARVLVRRVALARLLTSAPSDPLAVAFAAMPVEAAIPEVAVVAAAAACVTDDLDGCDKHLGRAQELVSGDQVEGDADLDLAIALTTLARGAAAAGTLESVQAAEHVLIRIGVERPVDAAAWALLGYATGCAQLMAGTRAAARESLTGAASAAEQAGRPHLVAAARARLALAEALDGRLTAAVEAAAAGSPPDAAGGSAAGRRPAALALAWVASERGDLAEAARRVQAVHDLPRDDVVSVAALTLVRARILRARGDLPGSLAVLDRLVSSPRALPGWLEDRLTAAAAQVWTLQGRPGDAVERVQHSADDGAACLLALGWAKLPLGAPGESGRLARQVLHRAELPVDLRVEAHLLAAAGALALGHTDPAAAEVGEATRWAAAEGLRRPLDEAPSRIRALLEQRTLHSSTAPAPRSEHPAHLPATPARDVLVQPLTEREREVLGYLDALLPTDEIAAEMFVSVNTVKTHVRAIMRKLSADRRNEAVRRARDLGLV